MAVEFIIVLFLFLVGASIGSFLNVLVIRFVTKENVVTSRSHCMQCGKILKWYELIPVFSFILLRGRCASCGSAIAVQYPIVEFGAGLAFLAFGLPVEEFSWLSILSFSIFCVLAVLFMIDLKTFLLPDFYIILLTLSVLALYVLGYAKMSGTTSWAVIAGSGFLLALWAATGGGGLGLGDVKLMIPLGLLFGLPGVAAVLFCSFILGGATGIWLLVTKKASPKTPIPFGPFLAGVAMLFLLWPALPNLLWQFILPL